MEADACGWALNELRVTRHHRQHRLEVAPLNYARDTYWPDRVSTLIFVPCEMYSGT
jgi:hypothetical protein